MPTHPYPVDVDAVEARPADGLDVSIDLRDNAGRSRPSRPRQAQTNRHAAQTRPEPQPVGVRPYLSARIAVRTLDLGVAVIGLLVLWPLLAALAIAVKLDSTGPALYGSPRLGHAKATFTAWKFRSMHQDADKQLRALLTANPAARMEYRQFHKLKDDPRLTRVGKFIRRTSLDELPQLINILMGEMSVVGPRPNLIAEGELFGDALPVVLQVRPGLTGLWQVSGRNRLSVEARVALDLEYARNRTLGGDLKICGRTFLQLWQPGKHGAY